MIHENQSQNLQHWALTENQINKEKHKRFYVKKTWLFTSTTLIYSHSSLKERHNTTIRNCLRFREIENKFNFHKLKMFSKTSERHTLRWHLFSFYSG